MDASPVAFPSSLLELTEQRLRALDVAPLDVAAIEVRLLTLPTRRSLAAAHDRGGGDAARPADRPLVVVAATTGDGIVGWGECSALAAPTYTPEWAAGAFEVLAAALDGSPLDERANPMAAAAVEMAALDAALRRDDRSLTSLVGAAATTVPAGASIGLAPTGPAGSIDVESSLVVAQGLISEGFGRIKVKIAPGQVDEVAHALSHEVPAGVELQVDANGSLGPDHLMDLMGLDRHGVAVVEQPFPVDRVDLAAELASVADALVVADEGARSVAAVETLLAAGALGGVVVKPPCLGGIAPALDMVSWCADHGVPVAVGGMLESGLGRHALAAVAGLDGCTIIGDLSPARQFLAADPFPDLRMVDGRVEVPRKPGVAGRPDRDLLDRFTVQRVARSLS